MDRLIYYNKYRGINYIIEYEENILLSQWIIYPDQSHLIAAHIIITIHQTKLGSADFISLIALPYRNACFTELCRALVVIKIVEYLIL